ncbi:MAG TPA: phosphoserine phosphatase SerB [Rhizomicrobium sp.]|nr:phosphoserine phosphatase SerB [Rhizomicrobium sp.]
MTEFFPNVLNVIVPDGSGEDAAPLARSALAAHGAAGEIVWLSRGHAFDIGFLGEPEVALPLARRALRGVRCDVNALSSERRRKRLLIADMDSTIISCECLDEIADLAGLKDKIQPITERAMRGELEFAPALRERLALLAGLPIGLLDRAYVERVRLNPGAKALVATMKRHGAHTMLVSSGATFFTDRVAREAGFDDARANVLLMEGGALSGRAQEPILGREAKVEALEGAIVRFGLDREDALCVGDGANDLDMIRRAGLGVAWRAKPILANAAAARLDRADLRGVLYLQGYGDDEIVEG